MPALPDNDCQRALSFTFTFLLLIGVNYLSKYLPVSFYVAFLRASGSLVGQSVAAVPRDVGLALRDGGRRVGDAAIALPRGVGRAAAESGRRVGEVI